MGAILKSLGAVIYKGFYHQNMHVAFGCKLESKEDSYDCCNRYCNGLNIKLLSMLNPILFRKLILNYSHNFLTLPKLKLHYRLKLGCFHKMPTIKYVAEVTQKVYL